MTKKEFIIQSTIANLAGIFANTHYYPSEVLRFSSQTTAYNVAKKLADEMSKDNMFDD